MNTPASGPAPSRGVAGFLGAIERTGNALPHPATLFAGLATLIVVLSGVFAAIGIEATRALAKSFGRSACSASTGCTASSPS